MTILDEIVENKIKQLEEEKALMPLAALQALEFESVRDFEASINEKQFAIIAEIKKASPSKGIIAEAFNVAEIASNYDKFNIAAISVLTEKKYFLGNDGNILIAKKNSEKPILRKDFIVDEYQLYQARAIGADAVLLIAAILKDKLGPFYKKAKALGLACLVEVHNKEEIELALSCGCNIIGINNRDLKDFKVSLKTTENLMQYIPKNKLVISESGIQSLEDIKYLKSIGVKGVLIGESFMRNPEKVKAFLEV
jgi:indole-3-glycerol phosphate synthase